MKLQCGRESEIVEALRAGHWPEACDAGLREHVQGCARCGDLVLVSEAMQRARVDAVNAARVEAAGMIWWRAQLRKRQAAMEIIARPVWGAQIFAWLLGVVVAIGFVVVELRQDGVARVEAAWNSASVSGSLEMIGLGLLLVALMGGVVAWVAVDRD